VTMFSQLLQVISINITKTIKGGGGIDNNI
jgi:hypothetical protein